MAEGTERAMALISTRLEQIEAEAASLERALLALAPAVKASPRRRKARGGGDHGSAHPPVPAASRRPRRAPAGSRQTELLAALEARPGASAADLAEAIGVRKTQVYGLLAKAKTERLIVRDGDGYRLKGA